ncbi:hypothetical protein D9619_008660 [Psilocybe cf. subviscida]|uniref:Uncharacterized protein n=1 Tax=Psilocybe cf. subviscida TaxID=2480587 RepID=A0A8H5BBA2_9AGAR|nr:hypothetical protein D9619_008660 [Psilocybe cf. subviscida]
MASSRSASPSPFSDAGPPPDHLEFSREFADDRYRVAKVLHDVREEIIRFQHRWRPELQVHDPFLDAVITHLRRFIPQMNRTGLVMLNDYVLSDNLRRTTLDNGVWLTYAPEALFPQTEGESTNSPEVIVLDHDEEEVQGQRVTEEEVIAFLEEIHPSSSASAGQVEEAQDAEPAANPTSNITPSEVLGKRPHADEEDDGPESSPPSPLKKQRHERSWSPSPSPGISNSVSDVSSPPLPASVSATAASTSAQPRSGPSSPSSSHSRSPPCSPRAAGSSARRSHPRPATPPGLRIIADHVQQPPASPSGLPNEVSIMAIDIGNGGLEIFERREAQRRLAEYNATRTRAPAPAPTPSPPPAAAPLPTVMPASSVPPALAVLPASVVPPVLAAPPTYFTAHQPPVAGPSVPAPSNGTTHLTHGTEPLDRIRLTRDHDFSTVTYLRRTGPPMSREAALDAERRAADQAAKRRQEEQEAAAAAAAAATTTEAGPSHTPKRSPKRRRAAQDSAEEAEREEAAASAEEERPAKRRTPSPLVAGPSKIGSARRARKSDDPKDKGKQPVRRSTRSKGTSA